jgi:hypothetical protein
MNRKTLIGLLTSTVLSMMLVGAFTQAGAQDSRPGTAPNSVNAPAAQVAGTAFTFQGQHKKNGGAFNGTCSFQFTLFDAATGGVQVDTPRTVNATVTNGLFTAELDFGNQFTGQARWLETAVKCAGDANFVAQSPRLNMTSSPYAIGLIPGASINGDIPYGNGYATFKATNASTSGGTALLGYASASSGATAGVFGLSSSPSGAGIWGRNGGGAGVLGESTSSTGVWGKSTNGAGVVGESGPWVGVYGHSSSSTGVWGESATGAGVVGKSNGAWIGVYGESASYEGVRGVSHNKDHGGVVGINDGGGAAVYGKSIGGDPATRFAGYFDGRVGIAGGTDVAERFSSASEQTIEPGTVVAVDAAHPGKIHPSAAAYDRTVVGIVSGAGGVEPGLVLHQSGMMEGPHVVAITGRVYVKATAANGAIVPGDLLTSSDLAGYAMKATDRDQAFGAIIGKALTGLDKNTGLVLVLVNLQ